MSNAKYVLVTPARNEGAYIEKTIQSVIAQTALPLHWVIVNDGSTDDTEEIIKKYQAQYRFIHLLSRPAGSGRNFGSKVAAIKAGIENLRRMEYDFIGFLDADVSFDEDFFRSVLNGMLQNPRQGIGGGVVHEQNGRGRWIPFQGKNNWSVSGAMQLFRRKCLEDTGGYLPLQRGGIEMIAETMARMHGWSVRTFEHIKLYHYRTMGTAQGSFLAWQFRRGMMEYVNGYHPLFQAFRFFSWMPSHRPYVLASLFRTAGYCWGMITREPRAVPEHVAGHLQKEQLQRLRDMLYPGKGASS